jgi:REP element-mobilizing transposase RayT
MVRGIERRRIVRNAKDRNEFVERLGALALETKTNVHAWALLGNHAHILLASGPKGLSTFMRRLLTGYASWFNRRHDRHGHLFQNRYKSIVCDKEIYFRELVRYIHLNPLRVGEASDLVVLRTHKWCGHSTVIGMVERPWQDREHVLQEFGGDERSAIARYEVFIADGVEQGNRPELVGGGLLRSLGGWSEVRTLRSKHLRVQTDERILGSGDFVESMLQEASRQMEHELRARRRLKSVDSLIEQRCREEGIGVQELRQGTRRRDVARVRQELARELVKEYGMPMAEAARKLGVSTSGICRALSRLKAS